LDFTIGTTTESGKAAASVDRISSICCSGGAEASFSALVGVSFFFLSFLSFPFPFLQSPPLLNSQAECLYFIKKIHWLIK
jgi:hypothetical protein